MLAHRFMFPLADRLEREMGGLLDSFLDGGRWGMLRVRSFPPVSVWEDAECLFVEAEIPGLALNELEIYAVGNELTIKGSRKSPADENVTYHRQERGTGEFARVLTLPVDVNPDKVEATLKDGVLLVTLPKAETAKPRKINIKTE